MKNNNGMTGLADKDITLGNTSKKLESEIVREICDYLATLPDIFFWRSNNVPVYDKARHAFRAMPKYTPKGLPDIMVIRKGHFIGLEVKVPNYWKFTDDQIAVKVKITEHGGFYYLVTSLQEVQDIFK